jgi:hypothetical protein
MEDDLMILLVEPEHAWVQERLSVPRRSDMSDFCLAQERANPTIISSVFG